MENLISDELRRGDCWRVSSKEQVTEVVITSINSCLSFFPEATISTDSAFHNSDIKLSTRSFVSC